MGIRLLNLGSGEDPQRQTPVSDRTRTVCNPRNDRKGVGPGLGPATKWKGSTTGPRGSRAKLRSSS